MAGDFGHGRKCGSADKGMPRSLDGLPISHEVLLCFNCGHECHEHGTIVHELLHALGLYLLLWYP